MRHIHLYPTCYVVSENQIFKTKHHKDQLYLHRHTFLFYLKVLLSYDNKKHKYLYLNHDPVSWMIYVRTSSRVGKTPDCEYTVCKGMDSLHTSVHASFRASPRDTTRDVAATIMNESMLYLCLQWWSEFQKVLTKLHWPPSDQVCTYENPVSGSRNTRSCMKMIKNISTEILPVVNYTFSRRIRHECLVQNTVAHLGQISYWGIFPPLRKKWSTIPLVRVPSMQTSCDRDGGPDVW